MAPGDGSSYLRCFAGGRMAPDRWEGPTAGPSYSAGEGQEKIGGASYRRNFYRGLHRFHGSVLTFFGVKISSIINNWSNFPSSAEVQDLLPWKQSLLHASFVTPMEWQVYFRGWFLSWKYTHIQTICEIDGRVGKGVLSNTWLSGVYFRNFYDLVQDKLANQQEG